MGGAETRQREGIMMKFTRLLLPTDFSESARHAFTYAVSLARQYGAEIHLLHVVEVLPAGYTGEIFAGAMTSVIEEITGYARRDMARLSADARAQGLTVHEHFAQGKPAAEILRVAREAESDLIVIGVHGRGALSHALFGSTTEKVTRRAPCAVLVCRPGHPPSTV
jgi:nucleotide-binding universal stress UspA family protein